MTQLLYSIASSLRAIASWFSAPSVWQDGNQAYYDGKSEDSCPYGREENKREWLDGYYGRKQ